MKTKRINITTVANSSEKNKTGSWRTHKPQTDYSKCIGCSLCSKVCPEGCITMKKTNAKQKPAVDYNYCKGCGVCANECPVKAISMEKDY